MDNTSCLNCVLKHVSQAMIVHEEEVPMGYPQHIYRVMGHLAEASRESISLYPDLANTLRGHRLKLLEDRKHLPPYQGLLEYTDLVIACVDTNMPIPGVPTDLVVDSPVLETQRTRRVEIPGPGPTPIRFPSTGAPFDEPPRA